MITASIEIKKIDVYNEVAKTTSYAGAKKEEDEVPMNVSLQQTQTGKFLNVSGMNVVMM